MGIR
jgi:signal peptidase I